MATKEEIIKQNLEFVYGKRTNDKLQDPDKVSYRPAKPKYIDPDAISQFNGDHEFLAPSFPCHVYLPEESIPYPSFEHALLASKFNDEEKRMEVRSTPLVKDVKRLISKEKNNPSTIHIDWTERCLIIAEVLLLDKFIRNKILREMLMQTGRRSLLFINDFNDLFWGVDNQHKGQNQLGKLLEKVRSYIDQGDDLENWLKHQVKLIAPEKVRILLTVTKEGLKVEEDCKCFEHQNKLLIGKSEDVCDIVAAHPTISRAHAMLIVTNDITTCTARLIDLGSANGTKINGVQLRPYELTMLPNDAVITFGASSRQYSISVDTTADVRRRTELLKKIGADPTAVTGGVSEAQHTENTVFVGNISFEASESDVQSFFAPCGTITQLSMPKDRTGSSGQPHKGIAFITFTDFKGVMQALARDGDELCGRNVKVKKSEARKPIPTSSVSDRRAPKTSREHYRDDNSGNEPNRGIRQEQSRTDQRGRGGSRDRRGDRDGRRSPSPTDRRRDGGDRDSRRSPSPTDRRRGGCDRDGRCNSDYAGSKRRHRSRSRSDSRSRSRRSPPRRDERREDPYHKRPRPVSDRRDSTSPPRRGDPGARVTSSPPRRHTESSYRQRSSSPSPPRRPAAQRSPSPSPPRRPAAQRSPSPSPPRRPAAQRSPSPSPPRRPAVQRSPSPSPPRRPAVQRSPSPSPPRRPRW